MTFSKLKFKINSLEIVLGVKVFTVDRKIWQIKSCHC